MDGILTPPQAIGGPELLAEKRKAAWEEYRSLPMPTRKSEEWRYTDLTKLDPERFERIEAGDPTAEPMASDDLPGVVRKILTDESKRSGTLVEIDATVVRLELAPEVADAGVVFAPIARIVEQRPDLIERFLFASDIAPMERKLWSLHVAALSGGYVLFVPQGVRVEDPVHIIRWLSRSGAMLSSH